MSLTRAAFLCALALMTARAIAEPAKAQAPEKGAERILWLRREGLGELRVAFTLDGRRYDPDGYRQLEWFLRDVDRDGEQDAVGAIDPVLIDGLWEIQRYYRSIGIDEPIDVYSCFRTVATNTEVGGRPQSYHLVAKAADIGIAGVPMPHLHAVCVAISLFGGVGNYVDHVHVDTGPPDRRW